MYSKKLVNTLIENESLFVPLIFTPKQIEVIKRKQENKKLSNSDKKQLYTSIKSKIRAISLLIEPTTFYLTAKKPIPERVKRAENILKSLPFEKAFISGSFLFKEKYNDIDVFVISKRIRGEEKKQKLHFVYIPEKALKDPIIQSAARSSLSKFLISREFSAPKMSLSGHMQLFQETALLIFQDKDSTKDIRELIFHEFFIKNNEILESEKLIEISDIFTKLNRKNKLKKLKEKIKVILKNYNSTYAKRELKEYIKVLDKEIKEFKLNEHLKYYKETYLEIIRNGKDNS
ncbi:hypothetical protein JW930_06140 [Candidatus Woesearchaeota archaeon]|nr:hypothetical protein [Candidatus Woesearchaeota archaeon]